MRTKEEGMIPLLSRSDSALELANEKWTRCETRNLSLAGREEARLPGYGLTLRCAIDAER